MQHPTMAQVEAADHEQLARWYRFLPCAHDDGELEVVNRVFERFTAMGMFTPTLSKKIGWVE